MGSKGSRKYRTHGEGPCRSERYNETGVLYIVVVAIIYIVPFYKSWTYFAGETKTSVFLDSNSDVILITTVIFFTLPCRFTTVALCKYLRNKELEITSTVMKSSIGYQNVELLKHGYEHKTLPQRKIFAMRTIVSIFLMKLFDWFDVNTGHMPNKMSTPL